MARSKKSTKVKRSRAPLDVALDSTLEQAEMFDAYVLENSFIERNAILKARAENISRQMHELYQSVGRHRPETKKGA